MATRKSRNSTQETTARASHDVRPAAEDAAARQGQQFLAVAEATSAWLRNAEILSQLHLQVLQRSGRTWREAVDRLHTASGPLDLLGVQNHLVMNSFMEVLQLAQDFVQAAMSLQAPSTKGAAAESAAVSAAAEVAAPTMQEAPFAQAWRAMLNPMALAGAQAASTARH